MDKHTSVTGEHFQRMAARRESQSMVAFALLAIVLACCIPASASGLWELFLWLGPSGSSVRRVIVIVVSLAVAWRWSNVILLFALGCLMYSIVNFSAGVAAVIAVSLVLFTCFMVAHFSASAWKTKSKLLSAAVDAKPPVLLLRSFSHDRLLYRPKEKGGQKGRPYLAEVAEVVASIPELGSPIMLGAQDEDDYPKVLFLPCDRDDWMYGFSAAAIAASAIVVIPETTDSLAAEILLIRQSDLIDKTLVLLPWSEFEEGQRELQKRWTIVQDLWRRQGISLPSLCTGGLVYRPLRDFSIRTGWSTDVGLSNALEQAGKAVAAERPHELPLSALVELFGGIEPARARSDGVARTTLRQRIESLAAQYIPSPVRGLLSQSAEALAFAVIKAQQTLGAPTLLAVGVGALYAGERLTEVAAASDVASDAVASAASSSELHDDLLSVDGVDLDLGDIVDV